MVLTYVFKKSYSEDMVTATTYKELKDVLLDPKAINGNDSYFTIDSKDSAENITVIYPGRNGLEFNKTLGFINRYPGPIVYRCIYGMGVILIQRSDETGFAKEVKILALRPGTEVEVPSGYGHTLVNTGRTLLALVDNVPKDKKYVDSLMILQKHGLAYYLIDKKGDIGFEKNPAYSFHPQITNY